MRIDRARIGGLALALALAAALPAPGGSRRSQAETGNSGVEAVLADVQPDEMWSIVERFSKIDRTSSSAGERRAVAQLEEALERFGIPYRRHEIRAYISIPISASLEILAPERFALPAIAPSFSAATSGTSVRARREPLAAASSRLVVHLVPSTIAHLRLRPGRGPCAHRLDGRTAGHGAHHRVRMKPLTDPGGGANHPHGAMAVSAAAANLGA